MTVVLSFQAAFASCRGDYSARASHFCASGRGTCLCRCRSRLGAVRENRVGQGALLRHAEMASPSGGSRVSTMSGRTELRSLIGVGRRGKFTRAYDAVRDRIVAVKPRRTRGRRRCGRPGAIPPGVASSVPAAGAPRHPGATSAACSTPTRAWWWPPRVAARMPMAGAPGRQAGERHAQPLTSPILPDLGIARLGSDTGLMMVGAAIGSCAYMAAERFTGAQVGPPADGYWLACLL